jgi:DNA polymerase III delta prime subunit
MFARGKSYLVVGEAGTGKSTSILTEARRAGAAVFRWNVRTDRSLREGRESLHTQVRSCEPLFVWIEGADDLTQEAQAFMRRILETASKNVTCILEAREIWKFSQPILSRCLLITMNNGISYRQQKNRIIANELGFTECHVDNTTSIYQARLLGADPYILLERFAESNKELYQNALRAIGSGKSPWIQLSNCGLNSSPTAAVI